MSEKARKEFDLTGQRLKDLYDTIKIIVPVISIIRELGHYEGKLSEVDNALDKIENDLDSLKRVIENIENKMTKKDIEKLILNYSKEKDKLDQSKVLLSQDCNELKGIISAYKTYVMDMKWATFYVRDLLSEYFLEKEEYLALLFILYDDYQPNIDAIEAIKEKCRIEGKNDIITTLSGCITGGLNYMLKTLKANEI